MIRNSKKNIRRVSDSSGFFGVLLQVYYYFGDLLDQLSHEKKKTGLTLPLKYGLFFQVPGCWNGLHGVWKKSSPTVTG